ncbi:MAG: hypothetical protein E2576_11030 [Alcaligenaceae bacterium]|nr:hypothetical protein [Alcaligenaceae bacterium SAGV5]MPS51259.1 hypothetical protein [Alcaligenaceae bacterium SAGV3]MPT57244.1 hypothetical protein [Alcaligenaceae bacterium]
MPSPFAALEARVNRIAGAKLANAEAVIGGFADPVAVIFDDRYVDPLTMSATAPQVQCDGALVPGIAVGRSVAVAGRTYSVAEIHPAGAGWLTLILEATLP